MTARRVPGEPALDDPRFDWRRHQDVIAGAERARDILEDDLAPSPELQAQVRDAATELELEAYVERRIDALTGNHAWFACVATARGRASLQIQEGRTWEQAFTELGVLDE